MAEEKIETNQEQVAASEETKEQVNEKKESVEPAKEKTAEAADEAAEASASSDAKEEEQTKEEQTKEEKGGEEKPANEEKPAEIDWKDRYMRLLADFDNFKKRVARDREDTYRYAEADILKDILKDIDNLQLALSKHDSPDQGFVDGIKMIYEGFMNTLKEHKAEPFDCVGKDLDIETMEAIAHLPSTEVEEGKVSHEAKRGWMLRGKVLRAAQVVVSSGKPA